MLRHEQDKFLDDVTVEDVEKELGVNVVTCQNDGYDLLCKMLGCE
jgi:NifB/MoaA-like Fe-S oxidoreductase